MAPTVQPKGSIPLIRDKALVFWEPVIYLKIVQKILQISENSIYAECEICKYIANIEGTRLYYNSHEDNTIWISSFR